MPPPPSLPTPQKPTHEQRRAALSAPTPRAHAQRPPFAAGYPLLSLAEPPATPTRLWRESSERSEGDSRPPSGESATRTPTDTAYHLRTAGLFLAPGFREPARHTPYYPASLGLEFFKSFRRFSSTRTPRRVHAGLLAEPMMSLVRSQQKSVQWEGGATAGVRTVFHLNSRFAFYGTVTSGPYFFTADVERQAPGFLFSDNFSMGLLTHTRVLHPFLLNTGLRYRHISNGDTRVPNNGINTIHLIVGLSRERKR